METLVAITLLMLVMVAFMSLARVGLTMSFFSRERVVAFYLAQEAMQYIANVHNEDIRANTSLFDFFETRCDTAGSRGCYIDIVNESPSGSHIQPCLIETCPPLRFDSSAMRYVYSTTMPLSPYVRTVEVNRGVSPTAPYEVEVRVEVQWIDEAGGSRSIELFRYFYDLKQYHTTP